MRITGGHLSGRIIKAPAGTMTRPTSDRVRAAVFNILAHHDWGKNIAHPFDNAHVLDAFCGSGALAFEALSRGALEATLFDKDHQALLQAEDNIVNLGLNKICRIISTDVLRPPRAKTACQLIFLDPPYRKNLVPQALTSLTKSAWIAPNALIVIETSKKEVLDLIDGFVFLFSRTYGDTAVHFVTH